MISYYIYSVYLIRNTEAITRATKETWNPMFCIVVTEGWFQMFVSLTAAVQTERVWKEETITPETMNWVLQRLRLTYYIYKYGIEEI